MRYELRLGDARFRIEVADDQSEVGRGKAERADATIEIDGDTLTAVLWDRLPLADAQRSRRVMVEGDGAAAERLVRLLPVPEPATA